MKSKNVETASITIGWKAVPGASGYVIFAAPSGSKYSEPIDIIGTSYTQKNLQAGTYDYFVAAHDKSGKLLAFSEPIHIQTP